MFRDLTDYYFRWYHDKPVGITSDRVFAALEANGIHPRKYFYPLTSEAGCYAGRDKGNTPVAAGLARRILTLPLYAGLMPEQVERIGRIIRQSL